MKTRWWIMAVIMALLLSGCGEKTAEIVEQPKQKSVVMVTKSMNSLHWLSVKEGAEKAANDYGVDLLILWPENESDVETQDQIMEDAIASSPDGVIWSPCNSQKVQKYTAKVKVAGSRLIFMDEEPANYDMVPFVGADNYHAGELAAQSLAEILQPGDTVAVIGGSQSQKAHYKRAHGFQDYIEKNTELNFLEIKEVPDCTLAGGKAAMEELAAEYPEIAGVFCASALMVMGAQEACVNLYRQDIQLVGMDTQSDAMTALADGKLHAMVSQNGYMLGYTAVQKMAEELEG